MNHTASPDELSRIARHAAASVRRQFIEKARTRYPDLDSATQELLGTEMYRAEMSRRVRVRWAQVAQRHRTAQDGEEGAKCARRPR